MNLLTDGVFLERSAHGLVALAPEVAVELAGAGIPALLVKGSQVLDHEGTVRAFEQAIGYPAADATHARRSGLDAPIAGRLATANSSEEIQRIHAGYGYVTSGDSRPEALEHIRQDPLVADGARAGLDVVNINGPGGLSTAEADGAFSEVARARQNELRAESAPENIAVEQAQAREAMAAEAANTPDMWEQAELDSQAAAATESTVTPEAVDGPAPQGAHATDTGPEPVTDPTPDTPDATTTGPEPVTDPTPDTPDATTTGPEPVTEPTPDTPDATTTGPEPVTEPTPDTPDATTTGPEPVTDSPAPDQPATETPEPQPTTPEAPPTSAAETPEAAVAETPAQAEPAPEPPAPEPPAPEPPAPEPPAPEPPAPEPEPAGPE